jgi:hypothetical protein
MTAYAVTAPLPTSGFAVFKSSPIPPADGACSGLRNRNPVSDARLTGKNCRNTCKHTLAYLPPHTADDTHSDFLRSASPSTWQYSHEDARNTCSNSSDFCRGICLSHPFPHAPSCFPRKADGACSDFLNKHRPSKMKARPGTLRNTCNNIFQPYIFSF